MNGYKECLRLSVMRYSKYQGQISAPHGFASAFAPLDLTLWSHITGTSECPMFLVLLVTSDSKACRLKILSMQIEHEDILIKDNTIVSFVQFSAQSPVISCKYLTQVDKFQYLNRFQIEFNSNEYMVAYGILTQIGFKIKKARRVNSEENEVQDKLATSQQSQMLIFSQRENIIPSPNYKNINNLNYPSGDSPRHRQDLCSTHKNVDTTLLNSLPLVHIGDNLRNSTPSSDKTPPIKKGGNQEIVNANHNIVKLSDKIHPYIIPNESAQLIIPEIKFGNISDTIDSENNAPLNKQFLTTVNTEEICNTNTTDVTKHTKPVITKRLLKRKLRDKHFMIWVRRIEKYFINIEKKSKRKSSRKHN
ncbi:Meiotic recombination protein REC114 [Nakaseomyces glabratus]|nr:Meiotic recombination protein REC114 [Nakaseomyces glabratus]KTB26358.1 Meiotic recombination protein REC114 [Nakaseomyces glabratus]